MAVCVCVCVCVYFNLEFRREVQVSIQLGSISLQILFNPMNMHKITKGECRQKKKQKLSAEAPGKFYHLKVGDMEESTKQKNEEVTTSKVGGSEEYI